MHPLLGTAAAGVAVGAAGLAYAVVEAHRYQLRRTQVPVLAPGARDLRILHITDLHLTPRHRGRVRWVQDLAQLRPDAVVVTGDSLAHQDAVPVAPRRARGRCWSFPGRSYWAPTTIWHRRALARGSTSGGRPTSTSSVRSCRGRTWSAG